MQIILNTQERFMRVKPKLKQNTILRDLSRGEATKIIGQSSLKVGLSGIQRDQPCPWEGTALYSKE